VVGVKKNHLDFIICRLISDDQPGSEAILNVEDACSIRDEERQSNIQKEEIHGRTCLWRYEIQSEL